jgi:uncharacterized protein (TIGR00255 family)
MIRSMTGFSRVRRTIGTYEVTLSLKSVNHRGLDLQFHMSPEFDPFESPMRTALKKAVHRGHVDVRISAARAGVAEGLGVDAARLESYIALYRLMAEKYSLDPEINLNLAFRVPGILTDESNIELPAGFEADLVNALEEAITTLNGFREREGAELQKVLEEHCAAIQKAACKMEDIRTRALDGFQKRLKDRLNELLNGAGIEPQRLAQEAAILADRSDIHEEIARLQIHARQLESMVRTESEIGKKLDFLLQEMNRETNTILSKTSGVGEAGLEITELALATKANIEKLREQALNVE